MPKRYTVKQGDCISSLAFEWGFLPDTVWNHADNTELRNTRQDFHILLPGDEVAAPDFELQKVPAATDERHSFIREKVEEVLRVAVHDAKDEPLANRKYTLVVDLVSSQGITSPDGIVELPIRPNAKIGKLMIGDPWEDEDYYEFDLQLGKLNPIDDVTGVQQRLRNLGFDCGAIDGIIGPRTRAAIANFQDYRGLNVTGELDSDTRAALSDDHLC